ncbi:MAG: hypothetical protein H6577_01120 [Lewinellaceae bacterium]|nr:hypothetical protein [Saprospiraceae bacterium]MCB9336705.1 hypothetical protein [Lewinellaceae bacterium]
MKNLIEISRIVTKKKVRKIEIFDNTTLESPNSKFAEFYEALMAGKFKNDRDAATFLYNCSPTHDKYRQLKSRFRKRLLNTLFFLDTNAPNTSNYDRAYFACNKEWTLVRILIANDAHQTAIDQAKHVLSTALKFKFADVIVNCCRILRQYAAEAGSEAEFEEYDTHIKQFSNILEAEIRSEEFFQRVLLKYSRPAQEIETLVEQLSIYCDALVGLSEMYESPIINYNMLLVWTVRYEMQHDYQLMLEVCEKAEQYIEDNPEYLQEDKLSTFHLKKMSAYLHLQDFKNGKANVEKSLQLFQEGSERWFLFMEYYLLLSFHTDSLLSAYAVYNRARSNSKFKKLDNETKEKWDIYEVYLNYFLEYGKEQADAFRAQAKKNFKVGRFLNDPLLYPKEQRVFTVHLVIAQFLFLMAEGNFVIANEKVSRLKGYAAKQLDPTEHYRIVQFVRLIVQLSKANYKLAELTNSEKYYDRLVERPFFYRGLINELEIVPYEKLWNHILSKLS